MDLQLKNNSKLSCVSSAKVEKQGSFHAKPPSVPLNEKKLGQLVSASMFRLENEKFSSYFSTNNKI